MSNIRNIAFMAHVDAGKTTLTEHILYKTGTIRALGSVDEGNTRTDDLNVERQRGISVRSAFASFTINDMSINLIDTPGHSDFYSQVERTFWAIDTVIVIVSAVDGIQSGTETIVMEALSKNVPLLFFINKCDRATARIDEVTSQIKEIHGGAFDYLSEGYETAALYDDALMRAFLDDLPEDYTAVENIIKAKVKSCDISPIIHGSAYTGEGVDALFCLICDIAPSPDVFPEEHTPSGVVFSVTHDKQFGRGAYIRLFSGKLSVRDTISIKGGEYKAAIIKQQVNGRWTDAKELNAGNIGLVYGLQSCKTGDIFGDSQSLPKRALTGFTKKALLTAQISSEDETDNTALKAALEVMTAEDPALELSWEPVYGKMNINVMGAVQIETLSALIEERFNIRVNIGKPSVIYKETLARPSYGFDAYTMPKPSWAILKFKLTPAKRGSGVTYKCTAGKNRIAPRYRSQVEQSIEPSLRQGLYGWEVTDIDIDLVDGEDHPIHTHPLDFTIATPLALMDGLRNGGTTLLEPILLARLTFKAGLLGRIMSDIIKMRGKTQSQVYHGDNIVLTALLPLASSIDYPVEFASVTSGHGIMTSKLHGYEECPLGLGNTCPRRGVDPLDRSKYILAARHAMSGTVFEV